MSLLDTASLIVTPNAYKEGKLYSVIPSDGSGDMSVVRATTATRVNSAGLVELVPYNLIRRSEEFNLIWSPVRSSITANSTTAPNGTLTADTLIDDTNNNIHYISQTFTAINGAATISIYAKANQISQIQLVATGGTTAMGRGFNLATGTTFAESVGGVSSNDLGQSITDVGNGWYRCEMSWTSTGQNEFWILLSVSNAATYSGTGANGVYIWGAQAVEGSTALPYQKTETRLNIPRLDYSNGTCPSLLVEPQRTNLARYSSSFDNAAWAKFVLGSGSTIPVVTANYAISPDGTQNADRLQCTLGSSGYSIIQQSYLVSGTHTGSIWVKSNTNANQNIYFRVYGNTTPFVVTPTWTRIDLTEVDGDYLTIGLRDSIGYTNYSCDISIWGAQLEAGSYSTSYIPTTSASVTRNADQISKTGISSLIGQTEGTLFAEIYADQAGSSNNWFEINDGTTNNWIFLGKEGVSMRGYIRTSSTTHFDNTTFTITDNAPMKVALAYKSGDYAFYINGTLIASGSSSFAISGTISNVNIGSGLIPIGDSSAYKATALWKTRLTNTQLVQLTTI
jgi:hypothetical protein